MADGSGMGDREVLARVVYALLLPAARVATNTEVPLVRLKRWLEMAYYHETKRRGMAMKEAMAAMSVSISKAAQLSRQLKANFAEPEVAYELPRRIEYALWAQPLSLGRLTRYLQDVEKEAIEEALEALVADGRVAHETHERGPDVYRIVTSQARQMWNTALARFDGLQNAMSSVTDAIYGRFFRPELPAFARTITFHIRDEDLPELERFFTHGFYPFIAALDTAASVERPEKTTIMTLSLLWAPDGASSPPQQGDES